MSADDALKGNLITANNNNFSGQITGSGNLTHSNGTLTLTGNKNKQDSIQ
ncbi:MAG: hypothetical protein LBC20_17140 [Planctomycetaceae bacterium]|nr:hypothetical protein [Planctomycetaceae bacterium]